MHRKFLVISASRFARIRGARWKAARMPTKDFVLAWEMFYPCSMSQALNGNGNSHDSSVVVPALTKPREPASREAHVTFKTVEGEALRAALGRMTQHTATFVCYNLNTILNVSEVLNEFSINFHGRTVYFGRAVVCSLVDTGGKAVCEVTLNEAHWLKGDSEALTKGSGRIAEEFNKFLQEWQKSYLVSPDFKLVVADMQTFLHDLQLWLDHVDLSMKSAVRAKGTDPKEEIVSRLAQAAIPAINALFERFEQAAKAVSHEHRAAHASYMRQHLHPLLLCVPFANRTFEKPRGYAGDYEMVNMIIRNGFEGPSLFAKILHAWFVNQPPAAAHRNRIQYLANSIERESLRIMRSGQTARIFNFACGPAAEIRELIKARSNHARIDFTLADFDEETLEYVRRSVRQTDGRLPANIAINLIKKSVQQLLKERRRPVLGEADQFDLVYCAGLFDYLPDTTCTALMDAFYDMVVPGGLLIATNVEPANPLRYGMEYLLDWHLIYRNEKQMQRLYPNAASAHDICVRTDATGVNLFLEVRKPVHGK